MKKKENWKTQSQNWYRQSVSQDMSHQGLLNQRPSKSPSFRCLEATRRLANGGKITVASTLISPARYQPERFICLSLPISLFFGGFGFETSPSNKKNQPLEAHDERPVGRWASSRLNYQWRNPSECGPPSQPGHLKKLTILFVSFRWGKNRILIHTLYPLNLMCICCT